MRFVDDDGKFLTRQLANLFEDKWELLQRSGDDLFTIFECLFELRRAFFDLFHDATHLRKLLDSFAQLLIECSSIGDDNNAIEHFAFARLIVQLAQPMRRPGDSITLTATSTVLDQVIIASAPHTTVCDNLADRIALVIAWEYI